MLTRCSFRWHRQSTVSPSRQCQADTEFVCLRLSTVSQMSTLLLSRTRHARDLANLSCSLKSPKTRSSKTVTGQRAKLLRNVASVPSMRTKITTRCMIVSHYSSPSLEPGFTAYSNPAQLILPNLLLAMHAKLLCRTALRIAPRVVAVAPRVVPHAVPVCRMSTTPIAYKKKK